MEGRPRFSWRFQGDAIQWLQSAYELRVAQDLDSLNSPRAWHSGKIAGRKSSEIVYEGPEIPPSEDAYWQVRVWDDEGVASDWSDIGHWAQALSGHSQWHAKWIAHPNGATATPVVRFRSAFQYDGSELSRARLHLSARGIVRAWLNGELVTDEYFLPGWTDYSRRIGYRAFEIAHRLLSGENQIELEVAPGWYSGQLCWFGTNHYGDTPAALCRVCLEFPNKPAFLCVSDNTWECCETLVSQADLIQGQHQQIDSEWVPDWVPVVSRPLGAAKLHPLEGPPVRVLEHLSPVSARESEGAVILDFGQNVVGVLELSVGAAQGEVIIQHGEALDAFGGLYRDNLRSARQEDRVKVLQSNPVVWSPTTTFHGFRYASVSTEGEPIDPKTCTALVLGSDIPISGAFECSDVRLNQLWANIGRSFRGNFLSVPTDCPQRDERLGWMGDILVFARTATLLGDVQPFLRDWLWSVLDGQADSGMFPNIAPQLQELAEGAPGWADAGVFVPMTLYYAYGDLDILNRCYPSMKRYVDALISRNPEGIWLNNRSHDFGDWLSMGEDADKTLIATAFMAESIRQTALAAEWLNRTADQSALNDARLKCKKAFQRRFWRTNELSPESQTAYVLTLAFDLLDVADRPAAASRLESLITHNNMRLSCGFLGVGFLLPVLRKFGRHDLAMKLLLSEECPSWLFPVKHGATSIWERWDGWTEAGGFQDPGMNSFNHYAFGAVGSFMMESVVGIQSTEAGRQNMRFSPILPSPLSHASGRVITPVGEFVAKWQYKDDGWVAEVTVPMNGQLCFDIEVQAGSQLVCRLRGNQRWEVVEREFTVGSGTWELTFRPT